MSAPDEPIRWSGVGSWPGTDLPEALGQAFELCPDLPYLPELPDRGAHAQLVGRGTAVLAGLTVDLQPAGWRLTDASGADHRRAVVLLRDDLDQLEERAQGYAGLFKVAVAGPWTLAASVERPRGDRVLADHGARRELAQSLTEGVVVLVGDLQRRLPGLDLVLQLDEPMLPAVLAGSLRTASGFSRHRAVEPPEVSATMTAVVDALTGLSRPVPLVVHSCAAGVPVELLHATGVRGLSLDLDQLTTADWDALGAAMEGGLWFGAGAAPTGVGVTSDEVAARVLRPLRRLGLEPEVSRQLVLTPACGLAGSTAASAVEVLRVLRAAAGIVGEELTR